MNKRKQSNLLSDSPRLILVPPLSEDFFVYGDKEKARAWALAGRYLLVDDGVATKCAHGFYMMSMCPDSRCRAFRQLDHVDMWIPDEIGISRRPFLLCHSYDDSISYETEMYANAHGLEISKIDNRFPDAWHNSKGINFKLTITENWPLWPIEAAAIVLLSTTPVIWPQDNDDG